VEEAGWELSGLQKTTSHRFEGRWEGESTRSAYLFFHREGLPEDVSVDVYLDETSRGLKGNLALVVDGPDLGELPEVAAAVGRLGRAGGRFLSRGYRRPISVRFRLRDAEDEPAGADTEYRFKVYIPRSAMDAGTDAVSTLCASVVRSFEKLLDDPDVRELTPPR